MEPLEPLESHILFVRDDGQFEVGTINQIDGKYVQTQSGPDFFAPSTHVVALGPHILSVRHDGQFEVGHINQSTNQYVRTDPGWPLSYDWTHVVAVGPYVLFVRHSSGHFEVGHIDQSLATYVPDKGPLPGFGSGWTHVVAVGPHFLLVRAGTGDFEVRHIDLSTALGWVPTDSGTFSNDWTHVVAVGPHVLFVAQNGQYQVGHIDEHSLKYVPTDSGKVFTGSTHVVAACSRVFLSRDDQFVVGHIDQSAPPRFVITQNPGPGVGGTPGPFHVVAVGPRVLSVSPDKDLGSVMHFDNLGQFSETDSAPDFASDWTHVVAVA